MRNSFKKTSIAIIYGSKMIQINTTFNPFRMRLERREPVSLTIELSNQSDEPKMLTMNVTLSRQLSFERGGYKTEDMARIEKLQPGEKKIFYYDIFPKAGTKPQEQPVTVKVSEHYRSFNYVGNEYTKNLALKVED